VFSRRDTVTLLRLLLAATPLAGIGGVALAAQDSGPLPLRPAAQLYGDGGVAPPAGVAPQRHDGGVEAPSGAPVSRPPPGGVPPAAGVPQAQGVPAPPSTGSGAPIGGVPGAAVPPGETAVPGEGSPPPGEPLGVAAPPPDGGAGAGEAGTDVASGAPGDELVPPTSADALEAAGQPLVPVELLSGPPVALDAAAPLIDTTPEPLSAPPLERRRALVAQAAQGPPGEVPGGEGEEDEEEGEILIPVPPADLPDGDDDPGAPGADFPAGVDPGELARTGRDLWPPLAAAALLLAAGLALRAATRPVSAGARARA
jgi:hypothetical protein